MTSPFKFLDAYELKDREMFFGRDKEIKVLYEMVFKTPLVLLYGLSGTGKTSLIQCGLASRFNGPDWLPIFIRREGNLNDSLHIALDRWIEDDKSQTLTEKVSHIAIKYFRPVYLIFDQFEELFTLGEQNTDKEELFAIATPNNTEQVTFVQEIKELLDAKLPCRIIIVIREEYLGALYHFEEIIPNIFDFRLRVEPMDNKRIAKVMQKSFKKFNITLEHPQTERLKEMIRNISGERSRIQLPYLQVYLDKLYRTHYQTTYNHPNLVLPPLIFKKELIAQAGPISEVLESFLRDQKEELYQKLLAQHPNLPKDSIDDFLDVFITANGTKLPIRCTIENGTYKLNENINLLPLVPTEIIDESIKELVKRRILRENEEGYRTLELAHDSLAEIIYKERNSIHQEGKRVYREIRDFYDRYGHTQFLNKKQLSAFNNLPASKRQSFLADVEVVNFIEESENYVRTEEQLRIRNEKRKRQNQIFSVVLPLLLLLAITTAWGWITANIKEREANAQKEMAINARDTLKITNNKLTLKTIELSVKTAETYKQIWKFDESITELNQALEQIKGHNQDTSKTLIPIAIVNKINKYKTNWEQLDLLTTAANKLEEKGQLVQALEKYQEADNIEIKELYISPMPSTDIPTNNQSIGGTTQIEEKIIALEVKIRGNIDFWLGRAESLIQLENQEVVAIYFTQMAADLLVDKILKKKEIKTYKDRLKNLQTKLGI